MSLKIYKENLDSPKTLTFVVGPEIGDILEMRGGSMDRTFIQTSEFSRRWDDLGFNDDDLRILELDIMENPKKYPVIKGTGRLRKGRVAFENRGKSGSARVCYVDFSLRRLFI